MKAAGRQVPTRRSLTSSLAAFAATWGAQRRPWARTCCLDRMLHPGPGPSDVSSSYTDSLGGQLNATHTLCPLAATSRVSHSYVQLPA